MVVVISEIDPVVGVGDSNKCWTQIRWMKRVPWVGIKASACVCVKFDVRKIKFVVDFSVVFVVLSLKQDRN